MKKRARFRIGQHVQSAADPTETFVIRRSLVPECIYFGANRWWTKNELQALGPKRWDTWDSKMGQRDDAGARMHPERTGR